MNPEDFKQTRVALGISQRLMAETMRLSTRQVSRYETGSSVIPDHVALLVEILKDRKVPKIKP
jgi:transcriptional regulator with XRE-family HTH domain